MGKRSHQDGDTGAGALSPKSKKIRTEESKSEKRHGKEGRKTKLEEDASTSYPTPISSVAQSTSNSSAASPEPNTRECPTYEESKKLTGIPQSQIDEFTAANQITIEEAGSEKPSLRPIIDFSYLPATAEAERAPFASFTSPTPIQAAAWPYLFSGRDVIGVAETGSGKTLAFGLPCIRFVAEVRRKRKWSAVIVSPTRELALQIHEQLGKLAEPAGLRVSCVYGGVEKEKQRKSLKKAHIVVATPGRLIDLLSEEALNLSKARYVVLDEADRMLDKGFEEDIRKIISSSAPSHKRQTLMFTATWPQSVRELASTFTKDAVKITIGDNASGKLRANPRIQQTVEVIDPSEKNNRLYEVLKQHTKGAKKADRILIFCLYKKEAPRIENFIRSRGFTVAGIHGDLSQAQRLKSLDAFKSGSIPLLVATDVAARGLDIPAVKLVVNVTFPLTAEDYVHRIGRTGRAGAEGKAITFFTEQDRQLAGALVNVLKAANQPIPEALMKFGTAVKRKVNAYGEAIGDGVEMTKKATKITFD